MFNILVFVVLLVTTGPWALLTFPLLMIALNAIGAMWDTPEKPVKHSSISGPIRYKHYPDGTTTRII